MPPKVGALSEDRPKIRGQNGKLLRAYSLIGWSVQCGAFVGDVRSFSTLCEHRKMQYRKFQNIEIKNIFNAYPKTVKDKLLFFREIIFQIADESNEIGKIEETLKWENPSYLTHSPKSGTTIRLSKVRAYDDKYAISVHCQTSLVSEFKEIYPELEYNGNRSIILNVSHELPLAKIRHFIFSALTYHYRKKHGIGI